VQLSLEKYQKKQNDKLFEDAQNKHKKLCQTDGPKKMTIKTIRASIRMVFMRMLIIMALLKMVVKAHVLRMAKRL
jgi:hypothetical protein